MAYNSKEKQIAYRERTKQRQSEYYKKWYAKNGRERTKREYEMRDEWKLNHPNEYQAQLQVRYAVARGEIKKPTKCEVCEREARLCGHHDDYSKPLVVRWLCQSCHKLFHINQQKLLDQNAR